MSLARIVRNERVVNIACAVALAAAIALSIASSIAHADVRPGDMITPENA